MMREGIRDGGEREGGREGGRDSERERERKIGREAVIGKERERERKREMHIPAVLRWPDCKMRISYQPPLLIFEDKKVVNDLTFTCTHTQDTLSLAPSVSNEGAVILL